MKIKTAFFTILFLSLMIGCSKEQPIESEENDPVVKSELSESELKVLELENLPTLITDENEIIEKAVNAMSLLENRQSTRTEVKRQVRGIRAMTVGNEKMAIFKSCLLNSENPVSDTLAYVVNFADSMGYVILAADRRIKEQILAVCPSGELGTYTDNPGLGIFLENAENNMLNEIEQYEQTKDSIRRALIVKAHESSPLTRYRPYPDLNPGDYDYDNYDYEGALYLTYTDIYVNKPTKLIPYLIPVSWGQGKPFNELVRFKNCSQGTAKAGCVPIAVAQIMAYWKYPDYINGQFINWQVISSWQTWFNADKGSDICKVQLSYLISSIGNFLGTDYGCSSSGTNSDKTLKLFQSCGYRSWGVFQKWNYDAASNSIRNGRPVFVRGYSAKKKVMGITIGYKGGHAWNVDGTFAYETKKQYHAQVLSRTDLAIISQWYGYVYEYTHFIHVNWGWDGNDNGYYNPSSFNKNNRPEINFRPNVQKAAYDDNDADEFEAGEQKFNYQYNIEMNANIYK